MRSGPDHLCRETVNFTRGHRRLWTRVEFTVSLQNLSGPDRFFDGSVPNFLCRVNGVKVTMHNTSSETSDPEKIRSEVRKYRTRIPSLQKHGLLKELLGFLFPAIYETFKSRSFRQACPIRNENSRYVYEIDKDIHTPPTWNCGRLAPWSDRSQPKSYRFQPSHFSHA